MVWTNSCSIVREAIYFNSDVTFSADELESTAVHELGHYQNADLTTTARGQPPKTVRLHVADARLAWSGGDAESFEIFSSTEQKLQWYLLQELARTAAKLDAPLAAPPPPL